MIKNIDIFILLKNSKHRVASLCCFLLMLFASTSYAAKPFSPSSTEVKSLPPYCVAKLGYANPDMERLWKSRMGDKIYLHLHHYCKGLYMLNRARFEPDKGDRAYYLNEAVSGFNYVIQRWPADFQLSRSARLYKTQAESMRGK